MRGYIGKEAMETKGLHNKNPLQNLGHPFPLTPP